MQVELSIYPYNKVEIYQNDKEIYQGFPYDYQLYQLSYLQIRKFTVDYTLDHNELFYQIYNFLKRPLRINRDHDDLIRSWIGGIVGTLVIRQDKKIFTYTFNNINLSKQEVYYDDNSLTNNIITFNSQFSFSSLLKSILDDKWNKYILVNINATKKFGAFALQSNNFTIYSIKKDYDIEKYPFQCFFINNFSNEYLKKTIKTNSCNRDMTIEGINPIKLRGQTLVEYLFFFSHLKEFSQNNNVVELTEKIQLLNEKFDKMEKDIQKKDSLIELLIEQNKMFKSKIDEIISK